MIRFATAGAALIFTVAAALAETSTWDIDTAHSHVQFAVRHLMVSTVRGSFTRFNGLVQMDEADITKSWVEATIDPASIDTREPDRDKHLRGPDFLDVEKHPAITFKSKKVERVSPSTFKITGDLTIRGVTREVVLETEGSSTPITDPWGKIKLGGTARTRINRQDFGITWNETLDAGGVLVGNEVDLTIDIELIKRQAAGGAT